MTLNNDKARQEIKNYIIAKYEKIEVNPGKCRWNFRCHNNAVHEASKNKYKKIAMCVYIDEGYPIVHFVNYKKGKFIDNTLGEWTTQYDYYFVKWIPEADYFNVFTYFNAFKYELGKQLNWWTRWTSNWRG